MNNTTAIPEKILTDLAQLRRKEKNSDRTKVLIPRLTKKVKVLLEEHLPEEARPFFSSRYMCPASFHLHDQTNGENIAKTIVESFRDPKVLRSFRVATPPAENVQEAVIELYRTLFSPYGRMAIRQVSAQCSLDFYVE